MRRLIGTALVLFVVSYAAVHFFVVRSLKGNPRLPAFHTVDRDSLSKQVEDSHASDTDAVRDGLRWAVLDSAESLSTEPCNDRLKTRYVEAATSYARAWLSVAPCLGTRTCGSADDPLIRRASEAFGSPLDHRVRDSMKKVHATDAIREEDFSPDIVRHVALLASDPLINPSADPKFKLGVRDARAPLSCRTAAR
jgi:hypothetical protein